GLKNFQCKLLVRGVGDTYGIESEEDRFILRIYRSSHRSLDHIKEEVRLLQALKDAHVSVSYPITDISGDNILKLEAIEGVRHAVLFSYAKGRVARLMNDNQFRALGNEMARFHNVSAHFKVEYERWNFDLQTTVFKSLERLKPVFKENPEDYEWLQNIAVEIERKLTKFDTSTFSKGYCHFDFLPKNFHFDHDTVTLFDFDFMGYGWLVNDIMTFWIHFVLDVSAGRMTNEEFQRAYQIFLD
ncbi:phosphotransferase enzyme family protein, partial [Elizabethkingia meningoseptica]|uniref:phosphotransferase enzyme family protein n=1 Tax=Elizabethkingia meningoseptica TaxID=238 RepID=UPI001639BFC5